MGAGKSQGGHETAACLATAGSASLLCADLSRLISDPQPAAVTMVHHKPLPLLNSVVPTWSSSQTQSKLVCLSAMPAIDSVACCGIKLLLHSLSRSVSQPNKTTEHLPLSCRSLKYSQRRSGGSCRNTGTKVPSSRRHQTTPTAETRLMRCMLETTQHPLGRTSWTRVCCPKSCRSASDCNGAGTWLKAPLHCFFCHRHNIHSNTFKSSSRLLGLLSTGNAYCIIILQCPQSYHGSYGGGMCSCCDLC